MILASLIQEKSFAGGFAIIHYVRFNFDGKFNKPIKTNVLTQKSSISAEQEHIRIILFTIYVVSTSYYVSTN